MTSFIASAFLLPLAVHDSSSSVAERVFERLINTPTLRSTQPRPRLVFQTGSEERAAVTLANGRGIMVTDGLVRNRTESQLAWTMALHLPTILRAEGNDEHRTRLAATIYREAGFDLWTLACSYNEQGDFTKQFAAQEEIAALALESIYGTVPQNNQASRVRSVPTLGQVEHVWDYTDPAWTTWFAKETGLPAPALTNRFPAGQCTALAFAIRPDFPFDPRGGGRNDAKNWLRLARAAERWTRPTDPVFLSIGVQDAWDGNPAGHVFIYLGTTLDGRIRAIDCNFGRQPDGKVRVRIFEPDEKIIGYISPPPEWRQNGQLGFLLRPNRTQLTPEVPYAHAPIDYRALNSPMDNQWLQLKIRAIPGRLGGRGTLTAITSIGESSQIALTSSSVWETIELGPYCVMGGGESITPQRISSVAFLADSLTLEISDIRFIER